MSVSSNNNGLFEETNEQSFFFFNYFEISYILNFLYVMFNEKSFNGKFFLIGNI